MKKRLILLAVLAVLLIIQFFKIDTVSPMMEDSNDFLALTGATDKISAILTQSCYDCHSYKTIYPWYAKIAPVSWLTGSHIKEAREHINFSEWGSYSPERQASMLEECVEEIEKDGMPLGSYTLMHSKARLSDDSRRNLIEWFEGRIEGGMTKGEE